MPRPASQQPALNDATFDGEDRDLFAVDDPRLRANALKHSLLPRLHVVLRACFDRVAAVYDVDPLGHARLARYPDFREQREGELAHLYSPAFSGVDGRLPEDRLAGLRARAAGAWCRSCRSASGSA